VNHANDPHLATVLSFVATPFANGLSFAFGGGSSSASPGVPGGFNPFGFDVGGFPLFNIFSDVGSQLAQNLGQNLMPNLLQDIGRGFLEGAINAGFQYLGSAYPWLNYILDENLAAGLTEAISRDGLFTVGSRIIDRTLDTISDLAGAIVGSIPQLGDYLQSQGPLGIVNYFLDSLFGRSTLEGLLAQGETQGSGEGLIEALPCDTPECKKYPQYRLVAPQPQPLPQPLPTPMSELSFEMWDAMSQLIPMVVGLFEGVANASEISINPVTIGSSLVNPAFIFGNGFNNLVVPEGTSDSLVPSFIQDLEGHNIIQSSKKFIVTMYEKTNLFGNLFQWFSNFVAPHDEPDNVIEFLAKMAADPVYFSDVMLNRVSFDDLPAPYQQAVMAAQDFYNAWFGGLSVTLPQKVYDQLIDLEKTESGVIHSGIAFSHSGFFEPLVKALQMPKPDGSKFDVHTLINYEGPYWFSHSDIIDNPSLERIINVWGTGLDFAPPEWSIADADFKGPGGADGIDNVNIKIIGAMHNDFSYSEKYWETVQYGGKTAEQAAELKRIDQERNRKVSLFMRDLYEAALKDQTRPGQLGIFFESLKIKGAAKWENAIWKIYPEKLRDEVAL
jgi:hypothetical protein